MASDDHDAVPYTNRQDFEQQGLAPAAINSECGICLEAEKALTTINACKHSMCKTCLDEWLDKAERHTCPFCRGILFEDDVSRDTAILQQALDRADENLLGILIELASRANVPLATEILRELTAQMYMRFLSMVAATEGGEDDDEGTDDELIVI